MLMGVGAWQLHCDAAHLAQLVGKLLGIRQRLWLAARLQEGAQQLELVLAGGTLPVQRGVGGLDVGRAMDGGNCPSNKQTAKPACWPASLAKPACWPTLHLG